MREGLSKYDILEHLKTLLGTDNAWRTSAELGKHFDTDSNQVAQLMFPLRREGLVITRNRAGTNGVREVMVSETGQVAQRGRKAPRTVEIRSARDIQVPVVEVKADSHQPPDDTHQLPEDTHQLPEDTHQLPEDTHQPCVIIARYNGPTPANAAAVAVSVVPPNEEAPADPPAAPFEPADNGGGPVMIRGTVTLPPTEADPLATELEALENTITQGRRSFIVFRKADKQRVLRELANRIAPDAPRTAELLRDLVHDLESAA